MAEWLKVFGLSFFSDKLASKSAKYGFVSIVLTIALSFAFFMFGFMAADTVPFASNYDSSAEYKQFVHNAFSSAELNIEIKDGLAQSNKTVNTYANNADKEKFALNGYNFIIDTRPFDTLIAFSQVAVKGDTEISYAEYLGLPDKDKESYRLEFRYTDKELELTSADTAEHEAFLSEISKEGADSYNKQAAEEYKKVKESNLTQTEYAKEIYFLYVKYYHSGFASALMGAKAPVLCDYYYLNFILGDNNSYLYMFDDICVGSFKTDNGIPAAFAGYYKGCKEGTLTADTADRFIKDVFYKSVKYSMSSYFTSAMQMAPAYVLIPVLGGFVLFLINKAVKSKSAQKFLECYKTVNSFAWFSALLTALITFALGFFVFARKLYLFMPLIFALIVVLRTAVFCITRRLKERAEREEPQEEESI